MFGFFKKLFSKKEGGEVKMDVNQPDVTPPTAPTDTPAPAPATDQPDVTPPTAPTVPPAETPAPETPVPGTETPPAAPTEETPGTTPSPGTPVA